MNKNSKVILTNQTDFHKDLLKILDKNRNNVYKKPIQTHNKKAFEKFLLTIQLKRKKIILDSCCGTGLSTYWLAKKYPNHFVVGIDQSEHRLARTESKTDNMLLLRTNCEDFWRLCNKENICFDRHFLFFPNPYPKKAQVKKRWYAHPTFINLIGLSKQIEVRSNWKMYIEEFQFAWKSMGRRDGLVESYVPNEPVTLFEKKYHLSGQVLYRFVAE